MKALTKTKAGGEKMDYKEIADRVLNMLRHADGNDPSDGHLTMDNWEWPTGVALYGIYKTYQQSGDKAILDYLTGDEATAVFEGVGFSKAA